MALPDDMLADAVGQAQSKGFAYPPTLFIHMVRDKRTAEGVAMDLGVLNQLVRNVVSWFIFVCNYSPSVTLPRSPASFKFKNMLL